MTVDKPLHRLIQRIENFQHPTALQGIPIHLELQHIKRELTMQQAKRLGRNNTLFISDSEYPLLRLGARPKSPVPGNDLPMELIQLHRRGGILVQV